MAVSKAFQINLGLFFSDNGIRRSVGTHALNYQSNSQSAAILNTVLQPGATYLWQTPASAKPSAVTIVLCSGPVKLTVTHSASTTATTPATIPVQNMYIVDVPIDSLNIENTGTAETQVYVYQA